MAAVQTALGAGQTVAGLIKGSKGQTDYEIPGPVTDQLFLAKQRMTALPPGYTQGKDNIGISTANAVNAAQQSGNALAGLPSIQAQAASALYGLEKSADEYRDRAFGDYTQASNNYARYADKKFDYNVASPERDNFREGRHLFGAGLTNINTGLNDFMLDKMMGKSNNFYQNQYKTSQMDNAQRTAEALMKYFQTPG